MRNGAVSLSAGKPFRAKRLPPIKTPIKLIIVYIAKKVNSICEGMRKVFEKPSDTIPSLPSLLIIARLFPRDMGKCLIEIGGAGETAALGDLELGQIGGLEHLHRPLDPLDGDIFPR